MGFLNKCEFCNRKKFRDLFEARDKNYNIPGKFKLVKCENCGLVFINPQPKGKELEKHYPKSYYSFNKISIGKKSKLRVFLYDLYFNPNNKNYFLKVLFLPIRLYIRGTKIKPNIKLLDIGCGSGQFLYEMKQLGLKTWGVEPGKFDEETSKKENLNIFHGCLKEAKYQSNYFDIVTMNHVLEHVKNPTETLKEIHRILKKNETFVVGVPNYNCLAYWLFRKNWYPLGVPRHLFDYNAKLLVKKLKEVGFKIEKIRYNSRPSQFSVSLLYLLNAKRNKIVLALLDLFFLPLTYVVNLLKIGGQIEIYCRK